ncbi:MAG: hypothetical protein ACKOYM_10015 [Actinomycetes bacterium]
MFRNGYGTVVANPDELVVTFHAHQAARRSSVPQPAASFTLRNGNPNASVRRFS